MERFYKLALKILHRIDRQILLKTCDKLNIPMAFVSHPKRFAESYPNLQPLEKSMPDLNKPTHTREFLGSRPGRGIHGPYGFCMCFVSSGHRISHQPQWPYGCRYLLGRPNWDFAGGGKFPLCLWPKISPVLVVFSGGWVWINGEKHLYSNR